MTELDHDCRTAFELAKSALPEGEELDAGLLIAALVHGTEIKIRFPDKAERIPVPEIRHAPADIVPMSYTIRRIFDLWKIQALILEGYRKAVRTVSIEPEARSSLALEMTPIIGRILSNLHNVGERSSLARNYSDRQLHKVGFLIYAFKILKSDTANLPKVIGIEDFTLTIESLDHLFADRGGNLRRCNHNEIIIRGLPDKIIHRSVCFHNFTQKISQKNQNFVHVDRPHHLLKRINVPDTKIQEHPGARRVFNMF